MKKKNVIIIGAGSHSRAIIDCIDEKKIQILGFIDNKIKNSTILGDDKFFFKKKSKNFLLVNGIYFNINQNVRVKLFETFKKKNFKFLNIKSKKSNISKNVILGEGSQILHGVTINCGVSIGLNTVINSGSTIEHDVKIGKHCTISPGSVICGNVNIGNNVNIGPGTIIFNNLKIGNNTFIQGGSTIRKNIKSNTKILNKNAI